MLITIIITIEMYVCTIIIINYNYYYHIIINIYEILLELNKLNIIYT